MPVPRNLNPALLFLVSLLLPAVVFSATATPKIERVKPSSSMRLDSLPGVFFAEDFEALDRLSDRFQDVSTNDGRFDITQKDPFGGNRSIQQEYLPLSQYGPNDDPGSAGWAVRFFGDSPMYTSTIPEDQRKSYTTFVASWYHKYEEGFEPRNGLYPNKNARLRCYDVNDYTSLYIVYYWTDGTDGHISMEAQTKVPGAHREWIPNHYTNFFYANPQNIGRWIHHEMRLTLGEGGRSDRLQAWADGMLICDVAGYDLAAGYRGHTPNAMMWDCYWNGGSPKKQSRFYDNLIMGTQPVGPVRTGFNPALVKSAFKSSETGTSQGGWEIEVAQGRQKPLHAVATDDGLVTRYDGPELDCTVVWRGVVEGAVNQVTVDTQSGSFTGPREGQTTLAANTLHFSRVRQRDAAGNWSEWSGWHSAFATDWAAGATPEQRTTPAGYMTETDAAFIAPDSVKPVIQSSVIPSNTVDSVGPYTVSFRVSDEHLMYVHLYYRAATDSVYQRVQMTAGASGQYSAVIPGFKSGKEVRWYVRARDLQWNETYWPSSYSSAPASFRVMNGDINGDGKVSLLDVLNLLLRGLADPSSTALDFNSDGRFSAADAVALARDILR